MRWRRLPTASTVWATPSTATGSAGWKVTAPVATSSASGSTSLTARCKSPLNGEAVDRLGTRSTRCSGSPTALFSQSWSERSTLSVSTRRSAFSIDRAQAAPRFALDLLEELRPSVADRFSVGLLMRRQIRLEHFQAVGGAYYLNDKGRAAVIALYENHRNEDVFHAVLQRRIGRWALPTVQATLMARFIRGDLPVYPPFVGDAA